MKQLLIKLVTHTGVMLVVLTVVFGPFQPLIAQADTPATAGGAAYYGDANADGSAPPASQGFGNQDTSTLSPAASADINAPKATPPATARSGCALWGSGSLTNGGDWAQCITDIVYVFTVGIGSGFAYVSAYFFDLSIQLSLNSAAYALTFVATGWTTARDLANMAFLFILIYIAFLIMFESETSGTVHMLAAVIIVALLVNFSFFFTRLAIDAGNILSIQFYNAITAQSLASTASNGGVQGAVSSAATSLGASATTKDLTASIMGMLNLQGLLGNSSFQAFQGSTNYTFLTSLISLTFLYISAGIMLWLITIMFFSVGVKFLFRIVVLWFLIIAAPLAFVAYAVPHFEQYFKKWRDALITHAFYPVAFMFIFLILTNFANQMSGQNGLLSGIFTGLATQNGNVGFIATIAITIANVGIRMGFVIAMLWVALEASKRIGVMGASSADKFGSWAGGALKGTMIGAGNRFGAGTAATLGAGGRYTAGLLGNKAARSQPLRNLEAHSGLLGLVGKGTRSTLSAIGNSSFDVRNAPVVGKALGDQFGKGQQGGYAKALEERSKAKEKRGKDLEPSDGQKMVARQKAENETGYARHQKEFDDAKRSFTAADNRVKELQANGRGDAPESVSLKAQVAAGQAMMTSSKNQMELLKGITEEKAAKYSGEGSKKEYAQTLMTRNIRNFGIITRSSIEAAAKLRHEKSAKDKIWEAAKKQMKEDEEAEKPAEASPTTEPKKEARAEEHKDDHGGDH